MKTKAIFTTLCTLFLLLIGIGCEDDKGEIYTIVDFSSKPCFELPDGSKYKEDFKNIEGVIKKNKIISFGDSFYYVRVPTKKFISVKNLADSINIYPGCIKFTEKDLNKKIKISGKLYYTQGDTGVFNMIAYIYVFTN